MPELPEVESLRLSLVPALTNARIVRARLRRRDICTALPAQRRAISAAQLLEGCTISHLSRRGKQLAIITHTGPTLLIHLGMSGSMLLLPTPGEIRLHTHVHAVWTTPSTTLIFRDPRRFGGITTLAHHSQLESLAWQELGPDALTISTDTLEQRAVHSTRAIKSVLLDQHILAGVGNIYADESLFRARLNPHTPASTLTHDDWQRLAAAVRIILAAAIAAKGSSLRDYVDAQGTKGAATQAHQVYGRASLPCTSCVTPLVTAQLGQRTTVWCPTCQK
ncbi:MAG: bifunctional DNA-formamidopyrimidine glycosylase/DNA-(apurinic or apyrimidinic site) lyase [Planctomycetota bacterium]|nr:bifunctional DNA-formamidopyrimidine glycosylase/DNA-(apurinic or apyrimidinic site) lyase [Planctomycetota bacterium]